MRILECVPNFSEGKNQKTIQAIADEISTVSDVKLLDIDAGYHANRTVMTFAGKPERVVEAAFRAIKKAAEMIDMRLHTGEHPRIGATDVCPLIPISGISFEEAIELSFQLGERVANELNIPVYLYEKSAKNLERKNLAWLRKGEYEGLQARLKQNDFIPDFGSAMFHPQTGISIMGVRNFLIAYNMNLDTKDVAIANKIAATIRESGTKNKPGLLKNVKAIGWYIKEFDKVQISMNLIDYKTTPIFEVYELVEKLATELGTSVTGSELVGMLPLDALTAAGNFFLKKNGLREHISQSELVEYAVSYLGLNDVKPFDPKKKIIEYVLNPS
jgi:glutamate formiminotransferase / formiminotetrahydrofolate cyclodeaminase